MRTKPVFLAFSGIELARFFLMARAVWGFAGSGALPQVLRLASSANIMLVAAFFFLGLDGLRYADFRKLALVGKAAALFSALMAIFPVVRAFQPSNPDYLLNAIILGGSFVWDAVSAMVLLVVKEPLPPPADAQAPIEPVELD